MFCVTVPLLAAVVVVVVGSVVVLGLVHVVLMVVEVVILQCSLSLSLSSITIVGHVHKMFSCRI